MLDSAAAPSERDLRLPRLHASIHRSEIRLQILRYHMMHHKDGSFLARVVQLNQKAANVRSVQTSQLLKSETSPIFQKNLLIE